MEKKKFSFYRLMSVLFFITGLVFGSIAFVSGTETGAVGTADEDGYTQTITEQVDYKLFVAAVGILWFLCAFFGYCDTKEDGANAMKELKGLLSDTIKYKNKWEEYSSHLFLYFSQFWFNYINNIFYI